MSKKNRSVREMLEQIYGRKCMIHQGIRALNPPKPNKVKYKSKSIAQQLTYHHLKAKRYGGHTTLNNGAVLCRNCHEWLEKLSEKNREQVNEELRQYKANFLIGVAEITTEGIQQEEVYKPEPIEEQEVITIPAYDFTEEEYQKYLQKRRQRELEKPRWKGEER